MELLRSRASLLEKRLSSSFAVLSKNDPRLLRLLKLSVRYKLYSGSVPGVISADLAPRFSLPPTVKDLMLWILTLIFLAGRPAYELCLLHMYSSSLRRKKWNWLLMGLGLTEVCRLVNRTAALYTKHAFAIRQSPLIFELLKEQFPNYPTTLHSSVEGLGWSGKIGFGENHLHWNNRAVS